LGRFLNEGGVADWSSCRTAVALSADKAHSSFLRCKKVKIAFLKTAGVRDKEAACFFARLKGLSHEIDFKNFDKKLHNLA
jgi:hypothetical protein